MKKLFGALVAMGVTVLMAVGVQAATYSAGVATAFEVAVSDAQVGSEITFTTDYATLLFRVDM